MGNYRRLLCIAAVLAAAVALGTPTPASAAFAVRYKLASSSTWTTVTDNVVGPNGDFNPLPGFITALFQGFTISASSTATNSSSNANLDLGVGGTPATPIDFFVQASFTGILTAPPPQSLHYSFTSSSNTVPAGTLSQTYHTWVAQNDLLFETTTTVVADTGNVVVAPGGGSMTGNIAFSASPTYSITTSMHIVATGTSVVLSNDSNNDILATPAPASLLLLAGGAPAMGLGVYLRRRREAKIA